MEKYKGKSIFNGVAIGTVSIYRKNENSVKRYKIENAEDEIERFLYAKDISIKQLDKLYEKALKEVGEVNAQIFEVHKLMLEDEDYNNSVENIIRTQKVNAEFAVASTAENLVEIFSNMENEYFRARAADITDISDRIVSVLAGDNNENHFMGNDVIIAAKDLAPSETVKMDKDKLVGFATETGSSNSHTAILARTMNIPALTGIEIKEEWNGKKAIIDGIEGVFIIAPDEEELRRYTEIKHRLDQQAKLLETLKDEETVTKGGKKIKLYANIGSVSDLAAVVSSGAEGIGLFRSEFLYLESKDYPTEEEQFRAYKSAVTTMAGKPVIIRTLDIGADKQAEYFGLDKEENPAMGFRAIRICLERQDVFKVQLRAILRASAYGKVYIMYPMIISVDEVKKAKEAKCEAEEELRAENIPFGQVSQGIMIETPAAALISDELAKEVDFFSIGTNDLTQYTLAVDRQNPKLEAFYEPYHKSIMRLIEMTVKNAHKNGIWAGICGELGADTKLTQEFMKMGVDELSVSPSRILEVRKAVRECE